MQYNIWAYLLQKNFCIKKKYPSNNRVSRIYKVKQVITAMLEFLNVLFLRYIYLLCI